MTNSHRWVLILLFLAACLTACERVEEPGARRPSISFQETIDAVPLSYGKLVAVSPAGRSPFTVALWFEGENQALTAVRVNTSNGAISKEVIVVPRN